MVIRLWSKILFSIYFFFKIKKITQLIGDHDFGVNCSMQRFSFRVFESMSKVIIKIMRVFITGFDFCK